MAALLSVQIESENDSSFIHCVMTDISDGGARLMFQCGIRIPDHFMLHLGGGDNAQWQCEVVWRCEGEAGVRFEGRPVFVAAG
jgi:hypothetical protein